MAQNQISSIVKDIRDIVRRYRAEAAIKLNETIIHERWEIGRRLRSKTSKMKTGKTSTPTEKFQ